MIDYFANLYDDNRNDDDGEPSFSFEDFRKWLSRQKDTPQDITEARLEQEKATEKEDLRAKFKKRVHDNIAKKKKKKT